MSYYVFNHCTILCFLGDSGVCFGVDRFDPGREITERIGTLLNVGTMGQLSHTDLTTSSIKVA